MNRDQIIISGLKATGFHGVFEHERENGQEFAVDLVVYLAPSNASTSDNLADTVDYGAISQFVYDRIIGEAFNLIETLAERIAEDILEMSGVDGIEVIVHKPQAPIPVPFDNVSLRIVRP